MTRPPGLGLVFGATLACAEGPLGIASVDAAIATAASTTATRRRIWFS
jgi:hypothetical protein